MAEEANVSTKWPLLFLYFCGACLLGINWFMCVQRLCWNRERRRRRNSAQAPCQCWWWASRTIPRLLHFYNYCDLSLPLHSQLSVYLHWFSRPSTQILIISCHVIVLPQSSVNRGAHNRMHYIFYSYLPENYIIIRVCYHIFCSCSMFLSYGSQFTCCNMSPKAIAVIPTSLMSM